jgi:hypothetical protein
MVALIIGGKGGYEKRIQNRGIMFWVSLTGSYGSLRNGGVTEYRPYLDSVWGLCKESKKTKRTMIVPSREIKIYKSILAQLFVSARYRLFSRIQLPTSFGIIRSKLIQSSRVTAFLALVELIPTASLPSRISICSPHSSLNPSRESDPLFKPSR